MRQPVELGDHQGVPLPTRGKGLTQTGALAVGSGQPLVDVDPLGGHAERSERIALSSEVLLVGGDPGVADFEFTHRHSVPHSPPPSGLSTEPPLRDTNSCFSSTSQAGGRQCR